MKVKSFSQDNFVPVAHHPSPEPLQFDRIHALIQSLPHEKLKPAPIPVENARAEKSRTLANNSEQQIKTPEKPAPQNTPGSTKKEQATIGDAQNPKVRIYRGKDQMADADIEPAAPLRPCDPSYIEQKPSTPHVSIAGDPIRLSDEGWRIIIPQIYKVIFAILGKKLEKNMDLSESELNDLSDATLPLIHKYALFDLKYGLELTFILSVGTIFYKKYNSSEGNEMTEKKSESEDKPKFENEIVQQFMDNMEEKKAELQSIQPRLINDLEFKKAQQLYKASGNADELSRADAAAFISTIEHLGIPLDLAINTANSLGPEMLQELWKRK